MRMLGERLREARVASGLSQAQLGAPYYTRAHVSAIELGKIRPAMKSLEHIAGKLGKPLPYFLEDAVLEQSRRELDFDVDRVAALAARATAADAVVEPDAQWAHEIGDVAILVSIYHGLAMSYRAQGDLETATAFLQRALSGTEVANDLTSASVVHNMLAVIAAESGRSESAYQHADRAIALV